RARFAGDLFQPRQRVLQSRRTGPRDRGVSTGGTTRAAGSGDSREPRVCPQSGPGPDASARPLAALAGTPDGKRMDRACLDGILALAAVAGGDSISSGVESGV